MSKRYQVNTEYDCPKCLNSDEVDFLGTDEKTDFMNCRQCGEYYEVWLGKKWKSQAELEYKGFYRLHRVHLGICLETGHHKEGFFPPSIMQNKFANAAAISATSRVLQADRNLGEKYLMLMRVKKHKGDIALAGQLTYLIRINCLSAKIAQLWQGRRQIGVYVKLQARGAAS